MVRYSNDPLLVELLDTCSQLMSQKRKSRAKSAALQLSENLPRTTDSKNRG